VIASGLMHHSKEVGIEDGLMRVIEVLLGCIVGSCSVALLACFSLG